MIGFSGLGAPSSEQARFMVRYIGPKPHLKVWRDGWRCIGRGVDVRGDTPAEAYKNWKRYTEIKYG